MDTPTVLAPTLARVAEPTGSAEPCLDTIVVDMNPQPLADQPGRRAVEDLVNEEPASSGDPGNKLGEVGGPPCRQRPQCRHLGDGSILAAPVAAADELVDEAPVVVDGGEVAAAAQDQRLVEGRLEMTVVGFDRTVLVRPDLEQGGPGLLRLAMSP